MDKTNKESKDKEAANNKEVSSSDLLYETFYTNMNPHNREIIIKYSEHIPRLLSLGVMNYDTELNVLRSKIDKCIKESFPEINN